MRKILAVLLFVTSFCNAQTVQLRCGFYPNGQIGKIYTDTVYALPKIAKYGWNGYGAFYALNTDSVGIEGSVNKWYTDTRARASISLTTTGTSGAATYSGGVLNIPQYSGGGSSGWSLSGNTLTAGSDILGSTNNVSFRLRTNNIQRLLADSIGNFLFNSTTSSGTTTPKFISFGGEYGTNTPGNYKNIKWRLYDDGTNAATGIFGVGFSSNIFEFQQGPNNHFGFFGNSNLLAQIWADKSLSIGQSITRNVLTLGKIGVVSTKTGIDFFGTLSIDNATNYNQARIYGTFDGSGYANARLVFAYPTADNVFTDLMVLKNGNVGIGPLSTPTSTLHNQGSFATAYTATATSLTATIAHNVIVVTATGQTITLPTAVGITGRIYTIKLTASGTGTVSTTSSQTIDGSTTYSLSAQYKYVTVQSDGANWNIIGNN